ncbi:MAG: hypothetical protein J6N43_02480 [Prevotella sp.]|nr:hypothetical protein [Prevotella sp.]MBO6234272.1 hypothetical protein [Prevotella sp.]
MKKEFNILKKPYLPPRVEFEELEVDPILDAKGSTAPWEEGEDDDDPVISSGTSLDLDFVINDEPLQ